MIYVVRTCLLSSRWKLLWTSMPCLNFESEHCGSLPKFAKFLIHVLSNRNHQIEVSLLKLNIHGAVTQVFVTNIANYAFSHNVRVLDVHFTENSNFVSFPPNPIIFSQSLEHFTLTRHDPSLKTPLEFSALTSLRLSNFVLFGDIFSKCVNLKNLTLEYFIVLSVEEFDIIAPRLSNLMLCRGCCSKVINLIAPQLENLAVIDFPIKYLNAPLGLSSFCYRGYHLPPLSKDRFHSLNKVTIGLTKCWRTMLCKKDTRKIINMLQEFHSARYVTLNAGIVESISAHPYLLSHHPSPFSNLIYLTIDSHMRKVGYKVKMTNEAKNFLLENSPNATVIVKLPKLRSF